MAALPGGPSNIDVAPLTPPGAAALEEDSEEPARSSLISLERLDADWTLRDLAYDALKRAIMAMRIYDSPEEPRLDERSLAEDLGISRTPVREALLRLQHEGLLRIVPRRGVFVIRKRKREIIEIVLASAALEGIAARLAAERATDQEIASVREAFPEMASGPTLISVEEYSEINARFHQYLVDLARSEQLSRMVESLQIHMRAIRARTMGDGDRMHRSVGEHREIVEALENRDAQLVDLRVRDHGFHLAGHLSRFVDYLD